MRDAGERLFGCKADFQPVLDLGLVVGAVLTAVEARFWAADGHRFIAQLHRGLARSSYGRYGAFSRSMGICGVGQKSPERANCEFGWFPKRTNCEMETLVMRTSLYGGPQLKIACGPKAAEKTLGVLPCTRCWHGKAFQALVHDPQ